MTCHRNLHMNWISFKRSLVLCGLFSYVPKVTSYYRFDCAVIMKCNSIWWYRYHVLCFFFSFLWVFFYSSWLGTYTFINSWEVKLILWALVVKWCRWLYNWVKCQSLHISGWSALCYLKIIMSGVASTKLVTEDESKPLQKRGV